MRVEPFGLGQSHGSRRELPQLLGAELEERRAFHEVEHGEAGRKPRRACGRQHVVGAADIVADRFRRVASDEDRAGIADAGEEVLGVVERQLDMLGCDAVDERDGRAEIRRR